MLEQVRIDDLQPGMYVNKVLEQTGSLKMRSKGIVKTQRIIAVSYTHLTLPTIYSV